MDTYKIEFSYLANGKRKHETDLFCGDSLKDALHECERCYGTLTNYYVVRAWKERPAEWIAISID